jgi:hypothetical protein
MDSPFAARLERGSASINMTLVEHYLCACRWRMLANSSEKAS